eukprot:3536887-Alexandrium_andersonii.AAC.1
MAGVAAAAAAAAAASGGDGATCAAASSAALLPWSAQQITTRLGGLDRANSVRVWIARIANC